jgi:hypothetical protein
MVGPIRRWRLVLLDAAGKQVAAVGLIGLKPGWVSQQDSWVPGETACGDAELPAACVFRRVASGEVVIG